MARFDFLTNLLGVDRERVKPYKEQGASAVQAYGGFLVSAERAADLQGQQKFLTYNDISSNISIIGASIRFYSNLASRPTWSVTPVDDTAEAQRYADFVYRAMEDCENSWEKIIRRCIGYKFSGVSVSEWTAKKSDDGFIGFRNIEARPPATITQWDLDADGQVLGFVQTNANNPSERLYIPRAKTIYIVDDMLTDQPDGLGLLRHCVEPVNRLRAMQVLEQRGYERDMRGLPVGYAPYAALKEWAGDDPDRKQHAASAVSTIERFVQMQVKGETTGMVLDSATWQNDTDNGGINYTNSKQWGLDIIQGGSNGLPDIAATITRLNTELARIFNTEVLILGESASSQALSKDKSNNLYLSVNSTLKDMTAAFNKDFIGPLWSLNGFPEEMRPWFSVEDVARRTAEEQAATLETLARAALQPDDEAINQIRQTIGLPDAPDITLTSMNDGIEI